MTVIVVEIIVKEAVRINKKTILAVLVVVADHDMARAGEPFQTVITGTSVNIPARDRGHTNALALGGEFCFPNRGKPPAPRLAPSSDRAPH